MNSKCDIEKEHEYKNIEVYIKKHGNDNMVNSIVPVLYKMVTYGSKQETRKKYEWYTNMNVQKVDKDIDEIQIT